MFIREWTKLPDVLSSLFNLSSLPLLPLIQTVTFFFWRWATSPPNPSLWSKLLQTLYLLKAASHNANLLFLEWEGWELTAKTGEEEQSSSSGSRYLFKEVFCSQSRSAPGTVVLSGPPYFHGLLWNKTRLLFLPFSIFFSPFLTRGKLTLLRNYSCSYYQWRKEWSVQFILPLK